MKACGNATGLASLLLPQALKGRNTYVALSGLNHLWVSVTQGVALGYYIAPLRGLRRLFKQLLSTEVLTWKLLLPVYWSPYLSIPTLNPRLQVGNWRGLGCDCLSSSDERFSPVSESISLIAPTLESMLDVSTGMKITFELLVRVMSRRDSM